MLFQGKTWGPGALLPNAQAGDLISPRGGGRGIIQGRNKSVKEHLVAASTGLSCLSVLEHGTSKTNSCFSLSGEIVSGKAFRNHFLAECRMLLCETLRHCCLTASCMCMSSGILHLPRADSEDRLLMTPCPVSGTVAASPRTVELWARPCCVLCVLLR